MGHQGTLPSSGHVKVMSTCKFPLANEMKIYSISSSTTLSSSYFQDKDWSDYSYTLQKSCGHLYHIFKVLWCLETPVEILWAMQRLLNHLTHIRQKLKTLLCSYRQARQSFFSRQSLKAWLTLKRGRGKHNKPLNPWKQDLPQPTHHTPDS